ALRGLLAPQTINHGGPVAFLSPPIDGVDAATPPNPVHRLSASQPDALAYSRDAIAAARGALVWTSVSDALYPAGWAPPNAPLFREGAVSFSGEERHTAALRRDALLLRSWAPLLPGMQVAPAPKPATGRFPDGMTAVLLVSNAASAVSLVNGSAEPFQDDIRGTDPISKRGVFIPGVRLNPGESLWLPVGVSLSQKSLCRECSNFSPVEQILYATAELISIEYENGILAMEFAAPTPASVVLQLERQPVGPFIASGKPTQFEWDEKTLRARLPIPAGAREDHHVRIGIAIEEPETSAFFDEAHRLIIGAPNVVSTTYSSPDVAVRSRLLVPEGYTAQRKLKAPNQIDYEVSVPNSAADGDSANFALEVDGMSLGRARLDLFRPLAVRLADAISLHCGPRATLAVDPPLLPIDPKAGSAVELSFRNNWPAIQTYKIEAVGEGLDIYPSHSEITIAPAAERTVNFRIFGAASNDPAPSAAIRNWHLRINGGAAFELPMRAVEIPRASAVSWSADLDQDGSPEWILESAQARAVFSTQDGGRWMEFTWKDGGVNLLPAAGVFAGQGSVEVHASGNTLEFAGKAWTRTVRLEGAALTVTQSPALPASSLSLVKIGNISLNIARESVSRARYTLRR
ncbi:MAG TPA: hypothetical protein VHW24_05320, partial [Bryobacteraceae bacterium]|nr:hypothetical protein [Bryobacteraceae bacterium]